MGLRESSTPLYNPANKTSTRHSFRVLLGLLEKYNQKPQISLKWEPIGYKGNGKVPEHLSISQ